MGDIMELWTKPIADTVFRHTRRTENDTNCVILHAARGGTAACQILVRDSMQDFTVDGFTVGAVPAGITVEGGAQGYEIYNDGIPYPDRLTGEQCVQVKANATQGYVFVIRTAADVQPMCCTVSVVMHMTCADGSKHNPEAKLLLTVHSPVIPAPKDSAFGHEYFFDINGDDETLISYARAMKELRVNSLYVNAIPLLCRGGSRKTGENTWMLDFSEFDRFIGLFLAHGSFRYLTLTGIVRPVDGKTIGCIDEEGRGCALELFSETHPEAEAFARAFFGGIAAHCREMGWGEMLRFHLEDEPHTKESWLWVRGICHEAAPGVPCLEPIDTCGIGRIFGAECDIPVPRLEVFDHDAEYYAEHIAGGREVWCYSCCFPEEPWWLNKFIDLPARYARMIKWACYSQHITGFLHWGFNFWSSESIYGINPAARFKGDGFIVYPDPAHHGVLMSNRGLSTVIGLEEWELLSQLGAKNSAAAAALARRVARTFRDFSDDPAVLETARAELFALLDGCI